MWEGRQNAKQPPNRTPEVFVWTYYVRENISDINLIIEQSKLCNIGRALGHTHLPYIPGFKKHKKPS